MAEEIIDIDGKEIKAGQVYNGFCCPGYDWTVAVVFPHTESVSGVCDNPSCPQFHPDFGETDPYRGATSWEPREFLEMVESGEAIHHENQSPTPL